MTRPVRSDELAVRVAEVEEVAPGVKRFRLEPEGTALPSFSGGAHVSVLLDLGDRRLRNPYSLVGDPGHEGAPPAYEITVLRHADSRGGSAHLHDVVAVGDALTVSVPGNLFPVHQPARRHLMLAGGIGITPFTAMAAQLDRHGHDFELHYAMRGDATSPYADQLRARYGDRVRVYRDSHGEALPLDDLLEGQPLGTHLYVCGPGSMIDAVFERARLAGWPEESLHCERFVAPPTGEPFTARLEGSGIEVAVGEHESLLEAIEDAGVEPPYLCRGGACGQCATRVIVADGELEHHDHYLTEAEREAGDTVMICMSRFRGRELVLDL